MEYVCASEDNSETYTAEDNAAQVSGINNETDECSVAMATIQKRRVSNITKCKWNDNYTGYGLYRTIKRDFEPLCFSALSILHSCFW